MVVAYLVRNVPLAGIFHKCPYAARVSAQRNQFAKFVNISTTVLFLDPCTSVTGKTTT